MAKHKRKYYKFALKAGRAWREAVLIIAYFAGIYCFIGYMASRSPLPPAEQAKAKKMAKVEEKRALLRREKLHNHLNSFLNRNKQ